MGNLRGHVRNNVVAYLALFVALGGSAYAAIELEKNDVTSKHIKNGGIKNKDIADNAVTSPKVANGSLLGEDFAAGQLPAGQQGDQGPAGQDATAPAGAVMFFNLASCPTGWSELDAAKGRYLVGVPSGGTLGGTSGTPLGNLESRPVGQHTHSATDSGHSHGVTARLEGSGNAGIGLLYGFGSTTTQAHAPGQGFSSISVAGTGSVAGTNAPYLQLRVCQKS